MIYTLDSSAGIWLQKLRLKASDITKPRGWWGHELETRFKMDNKWKGSGGIKDRYKNLLQLKLILNHCNNLSRVDNHVTRSSGIKSVAGVVIGRFRSYRLQNTWGKLFKTASALLQSFVPKVEAFEQLKITYSRNFDCAIHPLSSLLLCMHHWKVTTQTYNHSGGIDVVLKTPSLHEVATLIRPFRLRNIS